MADRRDRSWAYIWWSEIRQKTKTAILNDWFDDLAERIGREHDVTMERCDTCNGKGSHVNPSIDSHGLTEEDFDEDEGFRSDYMSGAYDQQCGECSGSGVVPVPVDEEVRNIVYGMIRSALE